MSVLGQPTVADLGKTKYPLDDTEEILGLGPDF
jgi:hypothetical protein